MALFVIIILALLAISITELERTTGEGVGISVQSTRAFYAAESGAQMALNELFPPPNGKTSCGAVTTSHTFDSAGLIGCGVDIDCVADTVASETYFTVKATGRCGNASEGAQRVVEVRAH